MARGPGTLVREATAQSPRTFSCPLRQKHPSMGRFVRRIVPRRVFATCTAPAGTDPPTPTRTPPGADPDTSARTRPRIVRIPGESGEIGWYARARRPALQPPSPPRAPTVPDLPSDNLAGQFEGRRRRTRTIRPEDQKRHQRAPRPWNRPGVRPETSPAATSSKCPGPTGHRPTCADSAPEPPPKRGPVTRDHVRTQNMTA